MTQTTLETKANTSSSTALSGLSAAEVSQRVDRGQTNNYKARVSRSYWDIVRDNLLNLFNIVLGTLLVIVIISGDYATAFFAGFSVVSNTFLGMIQEINAKRKLDQLAAVSQQQSTVIRDGQKQQVAISAIVKDDLVVVEPGDRVVVDGRVVRSDGLEMDESLLTGESDAVLKDEDDELFSGSFVIAGTGTMQATRVGKDSNINKLSSIAKQYRNTKTPTQVYIEIMVEITVVIMFIFVPMLLISNLVVDGIPFLDAIRNSVVFVTSLVPQGLVLVAILSLTIGAIRISRHQTLVQKVNAVESLANVTVLCFDKTGTLTKNELRVSELIPLNDTPIEQVERWLGEYMHNLGYRNRTAGAVEEYIARNLNGGEMRTKTREIPFNSARKWGAIMFDDGAFAFGAPERIFPSDADIISRSQKLQREGMRVLAFARLTQNPDNLDTVREYCEPLALIILSDTIREDIRETLDSLRGEGLELKVVSGDNLETVRSIAEQSGMTITESYSGDDLMDLNDGELEGVVMTGNVFARVEPHTKQRIVAALQRRNQYVAMVGDGVNDVPALKQADLAIVMNDGTQISKDVADIVLLNNAMSTLPRAFAEGKEITQTIFGTMKIFLVKNMYNVLLFLFIGFMALPFPITPVQISWSTFGTVNIPATLIAFGILRPKYMHNFRDDVLDFILTGGFIGSVLLGVLYVVVYFGTGQDLVATRTNVTIFLTLFGAYLILAVQGVNFYEPKTFRENLRLVLIMIGLATLTILGMYMQPELFSFYIINPATDFWMIILIIALFQLSMILLAHGLRYRYLIKRFYRLFERH